MLTLEDHLRVSRHVINFLRSGYKMWEMSRPFILLFQNNTTSSALRTSWLPSLFLAITSCY